MARLKCTFNHTLTDLIASGCSWKELHKVTGAGSQHKTGTMQLFVNCTTHGSFARSKLLKEKDEKNGKPAS